MSGSERRHGLDGERLVAAVLTDMKAHGLRPDVRELERLHLAAELTDDLAAYRGRVTEDGLTLPTRAGGRMAHPLVASIRETSKAIARLLDGISLDAATVVKDATKQRAANTRWARERARGTE